LEKIDIERILRSMLRSRIFESQGRPEPERKWEGSQTLGRLYPQLCEDELGTVMDSLLHMLQLQTLSPQFASAPAATLPADTLIHALHTAWHAQQHGVIAFRTSGSTGVPVTCLQSLDRLWEEIHELTSIFQAQNISRIVAVVPQHHIYGFLFSVLLPRSLKVDCLPLPPYPGKAFLNQLREGDAVIGFPLFWKGFAALPQTIPFRVHGTTSTGPCSPDVLEAVIAQGVTDVMEIYGSSETGGMGYRHSTNMPYQLFSYLRHENGTLIRVDDSGAEVFRMPFPDNVEWQTDRLFCPTSRKDHAVQVAGKNVYPQRVEAILNEHPDVQECSVRLMRQEEGNRLKAFIVPAQRCSDTSRLCSQLRSWCAERCSVPEVPKSFTFGKELPRNTIGKVQDW
jgi:4-coumarate--CoA ligase (photoactive yellow protein activation family)